MKKISLLIIAGTILAASLPITQLHATGLYIDFTSYFAPIDTSWVAISFSQAQLQQDGMNSMVLSADLSWRFREKALVRLQLPYPTVRTDMGFSHGIGDGIVRGSYRLMGDTLNTSGLYLLGDARLPMGEKAHLPLSYGSLDGGGGFEFRRKTSFFQLRFASTFTLAGERVKTGPFIHDNYFTIAFSLETELFGGTSLAFSGFGLIYRGGETREIYVLSVQKHVIGGIGFVLSGALEAGSKEMRAFDSQLGIFLRYALPAPADVEK